MSVTLKFTKKSEEIKIKTWERAGSIQSLEYNIFNISSLLYFTWTEHLKKKYQAFLLLHDLGHTPLPPKKMPARVGEYVSAMQRVERQWARGGGGRTQKRRQQKSQGLYSLGSVYVCVELRGGRRKTPRNMHRQVFFLQIFLPILKNFQKEIASKFRCC